MRSDLASEHKLTQTLAEPGLSNVSKTTPEGAAERLDRRSEVLNEALAKETERNVRRRKEVGTTARELAAPRAIPAGSDPLKNVQGKQRQQLRAVAAHTWKAAVHSGRDEFRSSKAQNIGRRMTTKAPMDESQMDEKFDRNEHQVKNRDENIWEEHKSDESAVAVTTQGSSDGIREKAMRIASIDALETGSSTERWSSPGGAEKKETLSSPPMERHEFAASDTKLEHELCRHCEESSDKSVHSSERPANQLKINEIGEV